MALLGVPAVLRRSMAEAVAHKLTYFRFYTVFWLLVCFGAQPDVTVLVSLLCCALTFCVVNCSVRGDGLF